MSETFGRLRRRLRYWLSSGTRARVLREEMEAHLEMMVQAHIERGLSPGEARTAAYRGFGNLVQLEEASRETWIARWAADLVQDASFAVRTLRKQPGFTSVAVLSAALGIGACSTIFGIANFALNHPLPVTDGSRLMCVSGKRLRGGSGGNSMAYPDIEDLRQAHSFEGLAAFYQFMPGTISSNGEPRRYFGSLVTANYFDVVRPAFVAGHGFDASRDDRRGTPPRVVLSYQLWQSRFAGDSGIAGRIVKLNGRQVTVAGVTGPGFRGTETLFYSDFWLPFSALDMLAEAGMGGDREGNRDNQWLLAAGRLRAGATAESAAAEIEVIAHRLRNAYPASNRDRAFCVERAGQLNPGIRRAVAVFFTMLLGVAALVLAAACANVANLLLARAAARRKEIGTRLAIGAGRGRVVRQLLTESAMLALAGGAGGYAMARFGAGAMSGWRLPLGMPYDLSVAFDYRVVLFSILIAAITGVAFGLVPALRATRPALAGDLKDDGMLFGRRRRLGLGNLLVVAQVCLSMVLLISSGLFLRSLDSARGIDTGLANHNLLLAAFDPSLNRYSAAETRRLMDTIGERVGGIGGVTAVTFTSSVPLSLEGTRNGFVPVGEAGEPAHRNSSDMGADIYNVAPGFFGMLGIPMTGGVDFRPGVPDEDIVIANRALADRAFGMGQSPVGRYILYLGRKVTITGLVANAKSRTIGEDPHPCLYFPLARDPRGNDSLTGITLMVAARGDPAGYVQSVRQAIQGIDPELAISNVRTMDAHLEQALFVPRTAAWLFGIAGLMGLLIATIGLYGVISFAVARQTREIGVRMALGANRGQVLGMVLGRALGLAASGAILGLAVALALSRIAASLLYGVSPTDAATFIAAPLVLLGVAMVASLKPAHRAASLDPIRTLRYE
jgi:predicted permease